MSYIYMEHLFLMFLDHTQRRSTVGGTPLRRADHSSQRPLPDNTRHSQQTNIHAPGGIRTHDFSRWAAAGRSPDISNLRVKNEGNTPPGFPLRQNHLDTSTHCILHTHYRKQEDCDSTCSRSRSHHYCRRARHDIKERLSWWPGTFHLQNEIATKNNKNVTIIHSAPLVAKQTFPVLAYVGGMNSSRPRP